MTTTFSLSVFRIFSCHKPPVNTTNVYNNVQTQGPFSVFSFFFMFSLNTFHLRTLPWGVVHITHTQTYTHKYHAHTQGGAGDEQRGVGSVIRGQWSVQWLHINLFLSHFSLSLCPNNPSLSHDFLSIDFFVVPLLVAALVVKQCSSTRVCALNKAVLLWMNTIVRVMQKRFNVLFIIT